MTSRRHRSSKLRDRRPHDRSPKWRSRSSRVIEMAWEDRTPFEAIERLYGLPEGDVIRLMRGSLKPKAFKNWRQRVSGRVTKHGARRDPSVSRGYCATQYKQRSK